MSPLPLLACFLLLGGLILALLYAIRRGIQEQQELDALSDVEYEDENEEPSQFSGPIVTQGPSQQTTPSEASAFRPADLSSK